MYYNQKSVHPGTPPVCYCYNPFFSEQIFIPAEIISTKRRLGRRSAGVSSPVTYFLLLILHSENIYGSKASVDFEEIQREGSLTSTL